MTQKWPSIAEFLKIRHLIDVIDIGSNPFYDADTAPEDCHAPYKSLLDVNLARVVGSKPGCAETTERNKRTERNLSSIRDL